MAGKRHATRMANLCAIFGSILEYVSRGGPFRLRSDRTADGDLVARCASRSPTTSTR